MKRLSGLLLTILFFSLTVMGQDNDCSTPTALCANNKITASNVGYTTIGTDPSLGCGPSAPKSTAWFTVKGISNGTATITISNIDNNPGLTVEAFTGTCGSLVTTGQCATANGPGASMSITFATTTGTLYYIMVSSRASNQEAFDILATSATNSIIARPAPDFIANPANGCIPLSVLLQNTSTTYGGTNLNYQWKFDSGSFINASGADTTILYPSIGTHTVTLKVGNDECGSKQVSQDIVAQDLVTSIGYSPSVTCVGTPVQFTGSAVILPTPPVVNPNITSWSWNFGDPNSGVNNTSTVQNPTHTFVGPGTSFNVQLIVQGTCGPDTGRLTINLLPKPTLRPSADQAICQGASATINVTVDNGANPISYNWSGSPTITCASCASTTVTGLAPGGPYTYIINIMDGNGCVADSLTHVTVHPTPVVNAGNDTTVCKYTVLTLSPTVTTGTGPFTYSWSPATGLNNPALKNPTATITGTIQYCVTVTDSIGCVSTPDCITINTFPKPTITAVPTFYCASDPGPYTPQFTVNGAGAGSTYSWKLSPSYSVINGTNPDSSVITANLSVGVVATYTLTVVVNDPVTGCADTVTSIFPVIPGVPLSVSNDTTICAGGSATLRASGATTYLWTASPAYVFADATQANQTVSPAVTTIFIVTGTQGVCSKTDSVIVTVHPKPLVNAGNDTTVCRYSTLTLSANVTAGTPPFTYSWAPATGLDDATKKNPVATIGSSTSYCVTVMDSIGCTSDPDCININIYNAPTVSSSHAPYCASDPGPDTTTLTVNGAGAGSTYRWLLSPNYSLITGTNVDSSSVQVTLPTGAPGNYTFSVIVNNPITGCTDTVTTILTVANGINMTVSPAAAAICNGNSTTLTASGATAYAWTASPSYAFGDTTLASQNVSPVVTTTFYVLGKTGTCTKLDSVKVTVNPTPVAAADSIAPFCGCTTVALNGTGSTSGMKYVWTSIGGSIIANPNSQNTTATVCSPDVFTLTVTDSVTGCFKTVSMPANSLPDPAAAANVTPNLVCNGATTTVTLDGTGSNAAVGTTYLWTSTPPVSIASPNSISTTADVTGSTIFFLTVTTAAGCDSVVTDTVNTYPLPTISSTSGSLCSAGPSVVDTISINGSAPGSTYNWTVIPGCVSPSSSSAQSQAFDFTTCGNGTYAFTVVVSDALSGCMDTLNTSVNVISGVTLVTSPDPTICEGDTVILFASGANSYIWSNGATTSSIVLTGLTASMSPDTIIVTGTVAGCSATDTIIITINPTPFTSAINGPANVCEKDTATLFWVTEHAGSIYAWSVTNGSITSGQGTDSIVVNWTGPGPAIVTVHETSALGCVSADQTLNVTVNANPVTPPLTGNVNVCANTTSVYFISPDPNSTYQWISVGGILDTTFAPLFVQVTWGAGPTGSISVIETNAAGCSGDTVTLPVTILPAPPRPTITGPDTVCENTTGVLYTVTNTTGSFWQWNVIGGVRDVSDTAQTLIDWGAAGTGMVFAIETDSNGCQSAEDTLVVFIDSLPVTSLITGNDSVCENEKSVIYTVDSIAGNSYAWTVTGSGLITSGQGTNTVTIDWAGAETDTITVTETNLLSCMGLPQTLIVTISPKPITSPIAGADTVCENSTQQYSILPTPGSTYQWIAAPGIISGSATDTVVSVMWGTGPTGSVKVLETSVAGCAGDTMTMDVTIIAAPSLPVITGPDTLCADSTGVIYTVTNNSPNYYLWNVTGGTISSANDSTSQITVDWSIPGVDTVRVTEVNASGCVSLPATLIVKLDTVPTTAPIAGNTSVCPNDSLLYSVNFTPGNIYTWTVTGDTIAAGQGTDSIWVKWTTEGTDTITVLETTTGGCPGILQTLIVTVQHLPDSTFITGDTTVCEGSTVTYYVTGDSASTFVWTVTGGAFVGVNTLDSATIQWGTNGSGLLQVNETSVNGCIAAPAFLPVTINPVPVTNPIIGNDTVCISDVGGTYYTDTITGGSIYTWSVYGGTITGGQTTDTITVDWTTAGADTISLVETNSYGCAGVPVTKVVMVNALPVAAASASKTTLCQNDTVQLTGVDSNSVYVTWYTSGSGTFDDSTSLTPIYTAGAADSGTVTLTFVVHNAPCANDSAFIILTVNPIPHIVLTPTASTICFGDTDTLAVSAIGSYMWSPGGSTDSSIVVSPSITTTYVVTATNSYGCSATDSVIVTVIPQGVANAGADQNICSGDSIFLAGAIANAGGGLWTTTGNGTFIPNATTLAATYVPGSNDTLAYQLILTTTGACLNGSDTLNVIVGAQPSVDAGLDQPISYRDSAQLDGKAINAGGQWSSSGTGKFVPDDTSLAASYVPSYADLQQDSIVLTLTSINGCRIVTDYMVIHFSDFQIPNVFTPYPNSPGYNDFFEMKGLPAGSQLKVWNRWGLLVFESENYRNDWDGSNVISDVYYYVVVTTKSQYHGWVQVIK